MSLQAHSLRIAAVTLAAILTTAACGDSTPKGGGGGGGGNTATFLGILSSDDATESGSVQLTVSTGSLDIPAPTAVAFSAVTASGSVKLVGGGTVSVTGSYDQDANSISVSGSGYSFTGAYDGNNRLEGTYTGPSTQGTFVTALADANTAAFCGTYTGDDQGVWNFVIDGAAVLGQAVSSATGSSAPLDGSISGNNISILFPGTQQVLATGTRSGSTVSGTWADPNSTDHGTWAGQACQ
ncbi:MAG TPA: hypothetical protein VMG41_07850 [Gemmatimonadales bacterium]|nr:hypothetical protein [Gemmatimonadales bacterium]